LHRAKDMRMNVAPQAGASQRHFHLPLRRAASALRSIACCPPLRAAAARAVLRAHSCRRAATEPHPACQGNRQHACCTRTCLQPCRLHRCAENCAPAWPRSSAREAAARQPARDGSSLCGARGERAARAPAPRRPPVLPAAPPALRRWHPDSCPAGPAHSCRWAGLLHRSPALLPPCVFENFVGLVGVERWRVQGWWRSSERGKGAAGVDCNTPQSPIHRTER
jgi:hypothetical protein